MTGSQSRSQSLLFLFPAKESLVRRAGSDLFGVLNLKCILLITESPKPNTTWQEIGIHLGLVQLN